MKSLLPILIALFPLSAQAGAGHDHGDGDGHGEETALAIDNPNAPKRQPDGSVFLPKQTQRFIQVRTRIAKQETLPRSLVLYGRVVAGTDAGSKVLALQAGRLDIPGGVLPAVGDRVEQGQLLATITLAKDAQEGANQAAEVADLQEQLKLAQLERQRLQDLGKLIPQRDLDAAIARERGLKARIDVLSKGTAGSRETIHSPISGIVTASYASNGQAVQAGDSLLEVIDPSRLQVEAVTYDPTLPANISTASLAIGQQVLKLRYQGRSPRLRQQAQPLRFSILPQTGNKSDEGSDRGLVAGLPVQVKVQTRETMSGVALPAQALVRNPSNQTVVWVKKAPELYAPRVVRYRPLDAERVMVTAGLQDGERVVVQATNLINQIR